MRSGLVATLPSALFDERLLARCQLAARRGRNNVTNQYQNEPT